LFYLQILKEWISRFYSWLKLILVNSNYIKYSN
jgi:hypothetical protein